MSMNYHDLLQVKRLGRPGAMFTGVHAMLKPGGVLAIHYSPNSGTGSVAQTLHRSTRRSRAKTSSHAL
jgi:predicted methyltransferase